MLKALRRSPASSGCSQRSFCSGVPASARISELPESGAALPNASGAIGRGAEDLVHQPEPDLAHALPAELGGRCAAHRPRALTCSCSGLIARSGRRAELVQIAPAARSLAHELRPSSRAAPGSRDRCEKSQAIACSLSSSTGLRRIHWVRLEPRWRRSISTASPRSTPRSSIRRDRPRTCTSAACCCSKDRRRTSISTWITFAAGCTSCRATARSWRRRRSRPAGRCGSTTRPSTSSTTSATRRSRRRGRRSSCSSSRPGSIRSRSTARSHCGRAG